VFARPAGLQGRCSGLRSFAFAIPFEAKGELDRVDGIEEFEETLCLFAAGIGSRDGACAAEAGEFEV
jgi:hypothetical protein